MTNNIKNKFKEYFFEETEPTSGQETFGTNDASRNKKGKKQALRDRVKYAIASANPKRDNECRSYMKENKTFEEVEVEVKQQESFTDLMRSYRKPEPSENREKLKNRVKSAIACANPKRFHKKDHDMETETERNLDAEDKNIQVEITTEELRSLEILSNAKPKQNKEKEPNPNPTPNHESESDEKDTPIPSISLSLSSVNLFVDATDITAKSLDSAMELLEENNYTVEYGEIFTKDKASILPNNESTKTWTVRMGKHNIYDYPSLDEEAIRKNMIGRLFETMHDMGEEEKKNTIIGIISNHRKIWGEVLAYGKKENIRIIFLSDKDSEHDANEAGSPDTTTNKNTENSVGVGKTLDAELETEFEVKANEDFDHVEAMWKTFDENKDGGHNEESGTKTTSNEETADVEIQNADEANVDANEYIEEEEGKGTKSTEDNESVATEIIEDEAKIHEAPNQAERVSLTKYEKFCIPEHYHDYFTENGYYGEILKLKFKDMTYAIPFFSGIREEVVLKILSNLSNFKLDYLQKNIAEKYWSKYHILIKDGFLSVPMEERDEYNRWLVKNGEMMHRILDSCDIYTIDYFIRPRTGKQKIMPVEWSYHTEDDVEKVTMIPFFHGISKSMLIKAVSMETGMEENFLKESLTTYLDKNHMFLKGVSIYPMDELQAKEA